VQERLHSVSHRKTLDKCQVAYAVMLAAGLASTVFESSAAHAQTRASAPSAADGSADTSAPAGADETAAPGTNTEPSTVPSPSTEQAPALSSSDDATADAAAGEPSERALSRAAEPASSETASEWPLRRTADAPATRARTPQNAPRRFPAGATEEDPRRDVAARRDHRDGLRHVGALLDAGLPDGLMAGVSYRPLEWLRLHAGAGTNGISPGVRAGALVVPFGVGPSVALEAGHYFEGDANAVLATFGGSEYRDNSVAKRVGYDFVNAHLGLEVGVERFTFFLHGGASYVRAELHDVNDVLGASDGDTAVAFHGNPRIVAWLPSVKLGFILYLV
jgi:hypothetical protein